MHGLFPVHDSLHTHSHNTCNMGKEIEADTEAPTDVEGRVVVVTTVSS